MIRQSLDSSLSQLFRSSRTNIVMPQKVTALICLLLAIVCGTLVSFQSQVSPLLFVPNLVAFALGLPLVLQARRITDFGRRHSFLLAMTAVVLLGSTLLFTGMSSVHRWIQLGPFSLNAAMALVPLILLGIARAENNRVLVLTGIPAAILVLQPDAGQATAFAAATTVLLISEGKLSSRLRWTSLLIVLGAWATAWSLPDPLAPVAHVEGIMQMAWSQGLLSKILLVVAVGALLFPFARKLLVMHEPRRLILVKCYLTYLIVTIAVTGIGNFPVPVIGAGAAPVLGWCLALALCD